MTDNGWLAVWPVAAFFLGGVATQFTGWLAHRWQRAERAQDAAAAFRERRENFELDHLHQLNEAIQRLGRAAARVHRADMLASRDTGEYAATLVGDEIATALLEANRDSQMLIGLVLDEDLRERIGAAKVAINAPSGLLRGDRDAADRMFGAAVVQLEDVQRRIAARIREIYLREPE
jgi:hypothetical protein